MQQDTEKNQIIDKELMEACKTAMWARQTGIWEQIHGVVLPQYQNQDINEEKK